MQLLKSGIQIGTLELPNRLVMPPMATGKSAADGGVTEELCEYYRQRARGGCIGLIIVEHAFVSPDGRASVGQLSLAGEEALPGLRKLTEAIHEVGGRVMAQLSHAGAAARREVTGCQPMGPSEGVLPRSPGGRELAREMTVEDIDRVTADFAAAAGRAKRAGFDGVEIHSAHGYLLDQFYSPLVNHRKDD